MLDWPVFRPYTADEPVNFFHETKSVSQIATEKQDRFVLMFVIEGARTAFVTPNIIDMLKTQTRSEVG